MPIISLTKVQMGRESTWGTSVAATAVLPVSGDPVYAVEYAAVRDQGRRGIAALDYNLLQGAGSTAITLDGPAYPAAVGHLLYAILGAVTTTGASAPYTHAFALGSTTPSYTIEDANPVAYREYGGARCRELVLAFSAADGLLTANSSWIAKTPSAGTVTGSLTAETASPWVGIDATVSLAASSNTRVTSFELTLARAQDVIHGAGSRDPLRIDEGPLEATISLALDAGSTPADDLAKYLGTSGVFTSEAVVVTVTYGSGSAQRALTFTGTTVNWGDGPATRDLGNGLYQISLQGRALYNTTDAGPCKVSLVNAQAAY